MARTGRGRPDGGAPIVEPSVERVWPRRCLAVNGEGRPTRDRQLATSAPSTTGLCQVGGWRSPDGRGDVADHAIGSEVDCSRASALDEACFDSGFAVSTSPVGLDPPGAGSRTDRHSLFE